MLLVVTYSRAARRTLRNVCRTHEEMVVRRFGRVAMLAETAFAVFQALRIRTKHGGDVQIDQTVPFNEFDLVDADVREAARAYENRDEPSVPYRAFAAGRDLPGPEELRSREL